MDTIKKSDISEHGPDDIDTGRAREKVFATTKVNVAFPFSQVKVQEPSEHLIALTALVQDIAGQLAEIAPSPDAERLKRRAQALARQLD